MAKVAARLIPREVAVITDGRRQEGMQTGWAEHHGSLDCALLHLGFGWSVVAEHFSQGTSQRYKELGSDVPWAEFQCRRPTEAEIRRRFDRWLGSGVFAVTGGVSDLTVLDVYAPILRRISAFDVPQGEAMLDDDISDKTEGRGGKKLGKRHPGLL
jgi:hypothetical protein